MHRFIAVSALVVVSLALSACVPSDGPLAVRPKTGSGMTALLPGTVRITAECVWVEADDASYIPVFEVGEARAEGGDILVYGQRYVDGDRIEVGGGISPDAGADWYVPPGCPDAELWAAAPPVRPS